MQPFVRNFGLAALMLLSGATAWAQATAQMSGTVRDESGAVLTGVTVTVTQTDTGFTRTVVTEGEGSYVMPNLPTGPYRLEVSLQGFRTYVQTGIVLQVGGDPDDERDARGSDGSRPRSATPVSSSLVSNMASSGVAEHRDTEAPRPRLYRIFSVSRCLGVSVSRCSVEAKIVKKLLLGSIFASRTISSAWLGGQRSSVFGK